MHRILNCDKVDIKRKCSNGFHLWITFITTASHSNSPVTFQNSLVLEGVAPHRKAQHHQLVRTGNQISSKTEADCETTDVAYARRTCDSCKNMRVVPHTQFENVANIHTESSGPSLGNSQVNRRNIEFHRKCNTSPNRRFNFIFKFLVVQSLQVIIQLMSLYTCT